MNKAILTRASRFAALINMLCDEYGRGVTENADIAELQFTIESGNLFDLAQRLTPYLEFCAIRVDYRIHDGAGVLGLRDDGHLFVVEVKSQSDNLTLAPVDPEIFSLLDRDFTELEIPSNVLQIRNFVAGLDKLRGGVSVELTFSISVDKQNLINQFDFAPKLNICFFFSSQQLVKTLQGPLDFVEQQLGLKAPAYILFMVSDSGGHFVGTHSAVFDRGVWDQIDSHLDEKRVASANLEIHNILRFRREQVLSDLALRFVVPSIFQLQNPELERAFWSVRDLLCLAFIANKVQKANGQVLFEFYGLKYAVVAFDSKSAGNSEELHLLFLWAYENTSSDKLQIVRHVISAQLSDSPSQNLQGVQEHAAHILEVSKSNFSVYIQKNAQEFLVRRSELVDRLHQFTQAIADDVAQLTSGLADNIYRTAGIGLGIVAAYLVNPSVSLYIIPWAASATAVYLLIVNFYVLGGVFASYNQKINSILAIKRQFSRYISDTELDSIEGNLVKDAVCGFRGFFAFANILYATLAVFAIRLALTALYFIKN